VVGSIILAIVIGYLLGSIPSAYIAGRLVKGVDIRQMGGGNVGAVDVMREIGTVAGFAVLLADMAKGLVAVVIAQWLGLPLLWVWGGEVSLIAYSVVLPLFCGLKMIPRLRTDVARVGSKKDLFIDRQYKPWQRRR
jgi:acyl-phosphate glycerol 3-phosphate acyltransferase